MGTVPFNAVTGVELDEKKHSFKKDKNFFRLNLNNDRKVFLMHAENETDLTEWTEVFKQTIEAHKKFNQGGTDSDVMVDHDDDDAEEGDLEEEEDDVRGFLNFVRPF